MFTGIVEELGEIVRLDRRSRDAVLAIRAAKVTRDAVPGDSISVSGACLTVVDVRDDVFTADVMVATLNVTSLGEARVGDLVNLERAATLSSRMGGHLVQGHVDAVAPIIARTTTARWDEVRIGLPAELARYVVPKGSICVDGVSLTAAGVEADCFTVYLIPTTLELTTLGRKQPGAAVNLEVDVIAKYVEKLLAGSMG